MHQLHVHRHVKFVIIYQSMLGDLGVKSLLVGDVKRDGRGVLDAFRELLGVLEGTAGCCKCWCTVQYQILSVSTYQQQPETR